jgi:ubiquinone/menaquinone biosynthesis C-methylase UbiE
MTTDDAGADEPPAGDRDGGADGDGDGREGREPDDPTVATRRTYDRIAEAFAATREHPWPEVTEFLDGRTAEVALDLGCGNGRHAGPLAERAGVVLAVDLSRELLDVARERARERGYADALAAVQADAATLPLRDGTVDLAVYVAALHHLRPRSRRVRSLDELARVLAPGARALVSAWSVTHDRFDAEAGFDTHLDWTLPDGERVPRFYHVYDLDEFRADLAASALSVEAAFVSSGNCYAVVAPDGRATTTHER